MAELSGTWLGTYWQDGQPTRFEASLVQCGNSLSGNVLDDGGLGEAQLAGEIVGKQVTFVKQYWRAPLDPIDYRGTVDDGENSMRGVWQIAGTHQSGNWEAQRSGDDLMQQLRRHIEQITPVGIR